MLGLRFERIHGCLGIACQDPPQVTNGRRFRMMPPSRTALTFNNWLIFGSTGGDGQFRQLSSMTQPSIITARQKNATRKVTYPLICNFQYLAAIRLFALLLISRSLNLGLPCPDRSLCPTLNSSRNPCFGLAVETQLFFRSRTSPPISFTQFQVFSQHTCLTL